MSFSEIELKRISNVVGAFCERRIPPHVRDQLRLEYETKRHDLILFERRPNYGGARCSENSGLSKAPRHRPGHFHRLRVPQRGMTH